MTNHEKLTMIKSAMETIAQKKGLDNKAKQRGLKSLQQAYSKYKQVATS